MLALRMIDDAEKSDGENINCTFDGNEMRAKEKETKIIISR